MSNERPVGHDSYGMVIAREQGVRDADVDPGPPTDTVSWLAEPVGHRGDIEGLRAVAVLLVLASHAGLPLTGGYIGVDVFFVISGFLITTLLLGEMVTTGRISLREFYARRARRLLPAVAVVLTVTGLLAIALLPRTRWLDVGYDMLASALYVQNWRLAGAAVDYQAQDAAVSPLQHFWSLAVEEQFYLVWPLLLVAVVAVLRSRRWGNVSGPLTRASSRVRRRAVLLAAVMMALVAVPSFAWSVYDTAANPAGAYFVTTTRLWELAAGGAVALLAGRLAMLPRRAAAAMSWAGMAAIAVGVVLYSGSTAFPGVAALLPVLGTAAVLAGGRPAGRSGAGVLLDTAPMRWIGKLSYSLYLWHWPLLAITFSVLGERSLPVGLLVVALSFVPAYLSFRFVEDPVRRDVRLRRDAGRSLVAGGAYTAAAVVASFAVIATMWPPPSQATSLPYDARAGSSTPSAPVVERGAMVLADNPRDDPAGAPVDAVPSFTPDPAAAKNDIGANFCGATLLAVDVRSCTAGDSFSNLDVALIGDSHAQQWTTPLSAVAKERKWRLTAYTKGGCPFVLQDLAISNDGQGGQFATRTYTECAVWRDNLLARLTGPDRPDMIVVSSGEHQAMVDDEVIGGQESTDLQVRGFRDIWQRFMDLGTKVVVIADTPVPDKIVPDCVADNRDSLTACTFPRSGITSDSSALATAARSVPGVTLINLNDAICPTEQCAPVIGGVLVYRDNSHVSATYAATLASRLNAQLPPLP